MADIYQSLWSHITLLQAQPSPHHSMFYQMVSNNRKVWDEIPLDSKYLCKQHDQLLMLLNVTNPVFENSWPTSQHISTRMGNKQLHQ